MENVNVLIVYDTDYHNTEKMALAVLDGVKSVPGTNGIIKKAEEVTADDLINSQACLIGSPVHMGSLGWRLKKMIDEVCSKLWMKDKLIGKVCGVFATGGGFGGAGGGCELTLLALLNNFAELGYLIVPLPKNTPGYKDGGLQWGPYGRSLGTNMEQVGVLPEGLIAAYHHGANVARAAIAVNGKKIFG